MPPDKFMPACGTGCIVCVVSETAGARLVFSTCRSTTAETTPTICADVARSSDPMTEPPRPSSYSSVTAPAGLYTGVVPARCAASAAASAAVAPGCATSAAW